LTDISWMSTWRFTDYPRAQNAQEFQEYVAFLKSKQIKSYLEIGSQHGCALWGVAQGAMTPPGRIVSVDKCKPKYKSEDSLRECISTLRQQGFDAHLFSGNSADLPIIKAVRKLSPFDAIFIDGSHTEYYVREDFKNYGRMAKIVGFHDIGFYPVQNDMAVLKVWQELKRTHKNQASFHEFLFDKNCMGIGILQWR